jgi:formylglycine-generating enzyme required for sulfatase activity
MGFGRPGSEIYYLGNAVGYRFAAMIRSPSGWCWLGSEDHLSCERPRHRVFIDAFEIAPVTVRRSEYAVFLQETRRESPRDWTFPSFADPEQPVVGVNWLDATAYCEWLSQSTGALYRLPYEAEWEKACKGGNDSFEYAWGNENPEFLDRYRCAWPAPQRVSEGLPNGYGLFHMGDNVHEWCCDWYDADYYAHSPDCNPHGPESGIRRASRGGSWRHLVKGTRAAQRSSLPPEYRYTDYGFRLVKQL